MCDLKRCLVRMTVFSADCTIGMIYGKVVAVELFLFLSIRDGGSCLPSRMCDLNLLFSKKDRF